MNTVFSPHMEILPPAQKKLWRELKPARQLGFVLYGGTAIALRLGHRASIDFDFFSEKQLERKELASQFSFISHVTTLQDQPNALSWLVSCGDSQYVKISFFGGIGIGRVGEPDITEDGILQVASLEDLMATKVKVILQRVEAKDYRDIAAMVRAGVSLSAGLASARKMYGTNFQPSESLKAMVYFEGGDLHTLTEDEKDCLTQAVKAVRTLPQTEIISQQLGLDFI